MSRILSASALASDCLLLASCGNDDFDLSKQYGPDPVLPPPAQNLVPDLKVAEVVGWRDGQTPTVPDGLVITAYVQDLANPRTVHTLPNGDVLVVQSKAPTGKPLNRPKDVIRGFIMAMAAGKEGGNMETNLITLLRDTDRDGKVDERSDLLTGLMSPFGGRAGQVSKPRACWRRAMLSGMLLNLPVVASAGGGTFIDVVG